MLIHSLNDLTFVHYSMMKIVIDISVNSISGKPHLLNGHFCKWLSVKECKHQWLFITNCHLAEEPDFNVLNLINSEYLTGNNFIKRFREKKKLQKEIKNQRADFFISSHFISKSAKNIYLLENALQLKLINQKKLKEYKAVITVSEQLKNTFLQKFLFHKEKVFTIPITPRAEFVNLQWEQKQRIKETFTKGYEFFLLTTLNSTPEQLTTILKSFSAFKKRFQTGMKLLLAGSDEQMPFSMSLLSNYKYKEDVLFTGYSDVTTKAAIAASAYGAIHIASNEDWILPQEVLLCETPIMMLQPASFTKQAGLFIYAEEDNIEDIVYKLMLLYKDEPYRKKVIENGKIQLSQFSLEMSAKSLTGCLQNEANPT